jgi:hypothetical protein
VKGLGASADAADDAMEIRTTRTAGKNLLMVGTSLK